MNENDKQISKRNENVDSKTNQSVVMRRVRIET